MIPPEESDQTIGLNQIHHCITVRQSEITHEHSGIAFEQAEIRFRTAKFIPKISRIISRVSQHHPQCLRDNLHRPIDNPQALLS
jgi:hypothetical protein